MSLIIIAGPAGAGKTAFAQRLGGDSDVNFVVSTDWFLKHPRDARPGMVSEDVRAILSGGDERAVILEGCEALRSAIKSGLGARITAVYWIECHQPKAECGGLTTQQERYLNQLRKERPDVPIYRVTNY